MKSLCDHSAFRLHGEDNIAIKRYVISFWNGVDLRYKLLQGPSVKISIAGIIISRVCLSLLILLSSSLPSHPIALSSRSFLPSSNFPRVETQRLIWKETGLDATQSTQLRRWRTWGSIFFLNAGYPSMTSQWPSPNLTCAGEISIDIFMKAKQMQNNSA